MDDEDDGWGLPAGRSAAPAPAEGERLPVKAGGTALAPARAAKQAYVPYSDEVAWEVCARAAAGESLLAICKDPRMPNRVTVARWRDSRPDFGEALMAALQSARYRKRRVDLARAMTPRDPRGRWLTYTPEVGAEICRRLAEGETLVAICKTEGLPTCATVLRWASLVPAFGDAYALARRLASDVMFDEAREIARASRPGTVWVDRLRFDVIRWQVARTSARKYVETMPELEAANRAGINRRLAEGWKDALERAAMDEEEE